MERDAVEDRQLPADLERAVLRYTLPRIHDFHYENRYATFRTDERSLTMHHFDRFLDDYEWDASHRQFLIDHDDDRGKFRIVWDDRYEEYQYVSDELMFYDVAQTQSKWGPQRYLVLLPGPSEACLIRIADPPPSGPTGMQGPAGPGPVGPAPPGVIVGAGLAGAVVTCIQGPTGAQGCAGPVGRRGMEGPRRRRRPPRHPSLPPVRPAEEWFKQLEALMATAPHEVFRINLQICFRMRHLLDDED